MEGEMPWFAKYDGVDGSSQSGTGHDLSPWTVTHGRHSGESDQAVSWTAIAMAEFGGRQSTPDSSAVATMITIEFDSTLHNSDGFFLA
jgi:hypothetical protein